MSQNPTDHWLTSSKKGGSSLDKSKVDHPDVYSKECKEATVDSSRIFSKVEHQLKISLSSGLQAESWTCPWSNYEDAVEGAAPKTSLGSDVTSCLLEGGVIMVDTFRKKILQQLNTTTRTIIGEWCLRVLLLYLLSRGHTGKAELLIFWHWIK